MREGPAGNRKASSPQLGLPRLDAAFACAALLGAVLVHGLDALPARGIAAVALAVGLLLACVRTPVRLGFVSLAAAAWTVLCAHVMLDARLPSDLHGHDFDVIGEVRGLPQRESGLVRFEFAIESATEHGEAIELHGPARLSWYGAAPELAPCSRWSLRLRLRPPRGHVNPGGYDGERGSVQNGIVAVGYVREADSNHALPTVDGVCIDGARQAIAAAITRELDGGRSSQLLRALAVGDQQGIDDRQWQVLRATGIGHLIAISGLHVGLFAAFGALLARAFWKLWPRLTLRVPGPIIEAPAALACALGYGWLAGFGVPTVRTLLMIGVVLLARLSRRHTSVAQSLALAALVILVFDPLAVLAPGFWLSFLGVVILVLATMPAGQRSWRGLPRLQVILSLALLPMTVWFFGQASLVGPLANLVAVPVVSLLVVPLTVAGSLLIQSLPLLGAPLLQGADWVLGGVWWLMEWLASLPAAQVHVPLGPLWALPLALIGVAWMLMPRGVPARALGMLLWLPLLLPLRPRIEAGAFDVWMFDVGQGLSMLVRTQTHALLYDAGPRYPSGYDLAEAAVIPSLHAIGVDQLDRIVISHGDSDHAGGLASLHLAFAQTPITSGEPERLEPPAQPCRAGEAWQWDGVAFRVVAALGERGEDGNARSCVILVEGTFGSLLLTGDATRRTEAAVIQALGSPTAPLLLAVPHHGSKSASSPAFIDAAKPAQAWVSAGYRNAFHHPAREVSERYAQRNIPVLNTAEAGYLHRYVGAGAQVTEQGRVQKTTWWRVRGETN